MFGTVKHTWLLQVFKEPLKQVEYKSEWERSDPFSPSFILAQALGTLQAVLKSLSSHCFFFLIPFPQLDP